MCAGNIDNDCQISHEVRRIERRPVAVLLESNGLMWYRMKNTQENYQLSDQLIRAISQGTNQQQQMDIDELIKKGVDLNQKHGALLPLQYACCLKDRYVLKLLIQKGAKVNEPDGFNRTALHYAAEQDEKCLHILLSHGADVNQSDRNGNTALHWASYRNNKECVESLLEYGADVDAYDFNLDTAAMWAARKGNHGVMKILLDYNADVAISNIYGQTALSKTAAVQVHGLNTLEDDACLDLLIRASGQFNFISVSGELLPIRLRDNRLNDIFDPLIYTPRSLLDQCRRCIRRSLGRVYLPKAVMGLPLPTKLCDFLLLKDHNSVDVKSGK